MQPNDEAPNLGDVATATAGEEANPIHALRTFRIDARLNVLLTLSSLDAETWDIGWGSDPVRSRPRTRFPDPALHVPHLRLGGGGCA